MDRIEAIVRRSPHTHAWLALLGDKRLLPLSRREALVPHAEQHRLN